MNDTLRIIFMNTSPISSEYSWFNMPRGIPCIFLLQIFSTMSFAVMYATLVLYMKQKIGLTGKLTSITNLSKMFIVFATILSLFSFT